MKYTFYLIFLLFATALPGISQENSFFLRDSIYVDRGISGTTDFAQETRIYFPSYDDRGRVLQQVREHLGEDGVWRPQSRRMFTYDGDHLVEMHIQLWSINNQMWLDQRRDLYRYENDLKTEFIRQKAPQGQLENERRWQYSYTEEGAETGVLLQQWNGADWEDLSRKVVTYNEAGDLESQVLQVWFDGSWRNVRSRVWNYETAGPRSRVKVTTVRVWSPESSDWVDQLRKIFQYNDDGQWISSRFESWQADTQEWVNTDRMLYAYDENGRPAGQALQSWDGAWENRGQVSFTFKNKQFLSEIEVWNQVESDWNNFLRYQVELDELNLLKSRMGMQSWNGEAMLWENRNYTQRYTYFWSEAIVNSVTDAEEIFSCTVPNPYPVGQYFFCDLPPSQRNYRMELYDMLGRPVYQLDFQSGEALSINERPAAGMYVLRIHDGQKLHHLQRIIINQ
ncbi:T9SS type A sorting domain-containing protein [Flavilitoribacter nigricans]|uniref:Secretion system C-terminal sorting domain-containing protein n=1 Tax=Flavilitoribacter nigricans (strain ATCC 23147 / DSM 23189 / NBRC 102662 / NCIMB 1420 / SS-2) TaxID=1122177 RepID=A0A2D0NFE9_FLAN2|nr:T9SS type A sorting domain-containing protein [Flavilitoribacter nigricans]PHN07110.1 hypothetical protein CRP01_07730 [Flavilitoribacter nigricans DSM 23189 = NBRC 102662]